MRKGKIHQFLDQLKAEYKENFKFFKYNLSWFTNRSVHSEILTIALTKKCNLECTYCWDTGNRPELPEMTTDQIKKTLDSAWEMGIREFNPFGGEPFIRKDIFEILEYSLKKGFKVTVTTNGTLVPEKKIIELMKLISKGYQHRLTVLVSLDGSSQAENDYIRGKNSFRKTIGVIEAIIRYRVEYDAHVSVIVNTVVSRNNFRTMDRMVELCQLLKVDSLHFITPTISMGSEMHMRDMVKRNLVILESEFEELDASIDKVKAIKLNPATEGQILNQPESLEEFKGFFRRQLEQHKPYLEKYKDHIVDRTENLYSQQEQSEA